MPHYSFKQDFAVQSIYVNMDEEEKRLLIKIYSENPILWKSGDPDHHNKIKRVAVKELVLSTFNNKYNIEALEKTFRSLRTCMSREIKKDNEAM